MGGQNSKSKYYIVYRLIIKNNIVALIKLYPIENNICYSKSECVNWMYWYINLTNDTRKSLIFYVEYNNFDKNNGIIENVSYNIVYGNFTINKKYKEQLIKLLNDTVISI